MFPLEILPNIGPMYCGVLALPIGVLTGVLTFPVSFKLESAQTPTPIGNARLFGLQH